MPIVAAGYVTNSDTLVWSKNTTSVVAITTGPPANTIVITLAEDYTGDDVAPMITPVLTSAYGKDFGPQARLSGGDLIHVQFGDSLGASGAPNHVDPNTEDLDFYYFLVGHIT